MRSFYSKSCLAVLTVVTTLSLGVAAPPAAAQVQYVYTQIPGPNPGFVTATGINNSGTVVGQYQGADGAIHGFLWTGGNNYTTFDFNGAVGTFPTGINDAGVIVGSWDDSSGFCHAFSGTIGNFTTLNIFGSPQTFANAINNKGEIVGAWEDSNSTIHGYMDKNGTITSFDFPGTSVVTTFPNSVNDFGQIVGYVQDSGPLHSFIFNPNSGIAYLTLPNGSNFQATGINNSGEIVGFGFINGMEQGVLLDAGELTFINPQGSTSTLTFGINDSGDIVGQYDTPTNTLPGFLARGPGLLDPVPDMIDPGAPAVLNNMALATGPGSKGHRVKGVAADGVTEAVIRIPAQNAGDQFTITLSNDQAGQSDSPNQDGALGNPGDTSFTQSQITVTAENVTVTASDGSQSQVPFAFAVYHAPIDFVRQDASGADFSSRGCPYASAPAKFIVAFGPPPSGPQAMVVGPPQSDDQLACRSVSLQISNLSDNTSSNVPVIILRPPVVMIHGLWDNWTAWNNFDPLVKGPSNVDFRFSIGRVSYDTPIGPLITASDPAYSPNDLQEATANSLGFAFNAPNVLGQIQNWIGKFEDGTENPTQLPAAAVQVDVVAHSMGGDIARTLVLLPTFLRSANYGQGDIHKLITIDTPHLGSPLASDLLPPSEHCLQNVLVFFNKPVFNTVTLSGQTVPGAVADLGLATSAISDISNNGPHALPTALIAGVYTNFSSLDATFSPNPPFLLNPAFVIRSIFCPIDALAQKLTSSGWPTVFNEANDAIVGENSQLDGLPPDFVFQGFVHSPGTEALGFSSPSVLDPDSRTGIVSNVISLLNTPVTAAVFHPLNP